MLLQDLEQKKLISPPTWLTNNTMFLTIMGSYAYGVNSDNSDMDLYGWCIPKLDIVFPHLAGKILGFDKDLGGFDQWQQHHVKDPSAVNGKGREYDLQVFNIVKYFSLLMDNNPNIIDSLFTPTNCILHCTKIGRMVRDNRKIFLHKGCWHRFKGYAYSQLHKAENKLKSKEMTDVIEFEKKHNISQTTTLSDIEKEMKERKLI